MEDKDLYDYFLGGKIGDEDEAAADETNPERIFYQQVQGNLFRNEDEGSLAIRLYNEDDTTVVIAQIDGKDHHIQGASSARSTFEGKKAGQGTTNDIGSSYDSLSNYADGANGTNIKTENAREDLLTPRLQSSQSILEISIVDPMAGGSREFFICQYCDEMFADEKPLRAHEESHSSHTVMIKSEMCDESVDAQELLQSILKSHTIVECDICHNIYKNAESLALHKKTHVNGSIFRCVECVRVFSRRADLEQHKRIHTAEHKNLGNVECDVCHKIFKHADALALHKNIHIDGAFFKCSECIRIFFNREDFEQHEETHSTKKRFGYERGEKTTRGYRCHCCDKIFEQRPHLDNHERIHYGMRPFKCQYCDKAFIQKTHVTRHEMMHRGEKPFHCRFCERRFGQKTQMKSHERTHTGERPYQCNFCMRTFTQMSHLTKHEQIHEATSGESDEEHAFHCSYCDKCYKHKKNLISHERKHMGDKPYKCKICDKAFVRKDVLRSHERKHPELEITVTRKFKCKVCYQSFVNEHSYEVHKISHRVEEFFICPICKLEFKTGSEATAHEKIHDNQGPFYCPSCGKPFITKVEIEEHIKSHVKQEAHKESLDLNL